MIVRVEFEDGSEGTKRHFTSRSEAYNYFNSICRMYRTVSVSVSDQYLYARCASKEMKVFSNVL